MSETRYIIYAEQESDGSWRPFLQMAHVGGEQDGNVYWLDPGKSTYKTEADALAAGRDAKTFGEKVDVDMKLFEAASETDLRLGKINIAVKCGTLECEAYSVEKVRVEAAIAKLAGTEEKPVEDEKI